MKILFLNRLHETPQGDFASYNYQEDLCVLKGHVDMRALVARHQDQWLGDLAQSHGHLSALMVQGSAWWWMTPFSRLDARPWGLEGVIKPLFFARAILAWAQANSSKEGLTLIGCPPLVAFYLKDFDPYLVIEGVDEKRETLRRVLGYARQVLVFIVRLIEQFFSLMGRSLFSFRPALPAKCLVLFERFTPQMPVREAFNYYYDSLFDSPALQEPGKLSLGCIDQASFISKAPLEEEAGSFHLLQAVTWGDVLLAVWQNIGLALMVLKGVWMKPYCEVEGKVSRKFWKHFLLEGFSRSIILKELVIYRVLRRCMQEKMYEVIVYPYEEKGYERAVLFACQGHEVRTIGYAPHPQHHLALAMKDNSSCPLRPSAYAVCGQLYVDYFEQWASKPKGVTHVWGSAKSSHKDYQQEAMPQVLRILLLLSHPHELDVFVSWLRATPVIGQGVSYQIRSYKSVPSEVFKKRLEDAIKEFPFISEAEENFNASLESCDVAVFNATSAGLLAVNRGKLSVHLSLDDFFAINPCFDNLSFMLHCPSSFYFAKQLAGLRGMPKEQVQVLWQRQHDFVAKIFSPIEINTIERDLLCLQA